VDGIGPFYAMALMCAIHNSPPRGNSRAAQNENNRMTEAKQGYTLTVQETDDPESLEVTLRFLAPPTDEWREKATGMLARLSCSRIEEMPGLLGGKCRSHSPEYSRLILEDALGHIHNVPPRGNSRAAQNEGNPNG
jgi:hypothetical protein